MLGEALPGWRMACGGAAGTLHTLAAPPQSSSTLRAACDSGTCLEGTGASGGAVVAAVIKGVEVLEAVHGDPALLAQLQGQDQGQLGLSQVGLLF